MNGMRLKPSAPALLIAFLVSWPAINHALVDHTLSLPALLVRVGLAVVLAMVAVSFVSGILDNYRLQNALRRRREEAAHHNLQRRADDETATSR